MGTVTGLPFADEVTLTATLSGPYEQSARGCHRRLRPGVRPSDPRAFGERRRPLHRHGHADRLVRLEGAGLARRPLAGIELGVRGGGQRGRRTVKVRLDCLFVRRQAGPVTSQAHATRVPQADRSRAMRARLLEATVELLVERGFAGHVDHPRLRASGREPGCPAPPLPDQERPRGRRSRAPHRAAWCRAGGRGGAAPGGQAPHPGGRRDARRPLLLTGLLRRARALGRRSHRRGADGGGRPAGAAGRSRDAPDDRGRARRRRVRAGRARARAGHPRPGPRTGPGLHDLRRLGAPAPDPPGMGRRPRQGAGTS